MKKLAEDRTIIALGADIPLFKNERVFDVDWAKRFPGAEWMPALVEKLLAKGFKVTTGDVALSHVRQGYWRAQDIAVVQHLDDPETEALVALGAKPLVIISLESPLYVPTFYDHVDDIALKFDYRLLFSGLFTKKLQQQAVKNYPVRFPIFRKDDIHGLLPWHEREFMVAVVANKYAMPFSRLYLHHPVDALKWFKRVLLSLKAGKFSIFFTHSKVEQLQDRRYSAFYFFGRKKLLKLYGKGWESLKNLPFCYRKQIGSVLTHLKPEVCDNKLQTIAPYKFSLCFENCAYPGYVTEKIIECFVAGVIPVYLGAPDIQSFVPKASFIDIREYDSWDELLEKLESMSEKEAMAMIQVGRDFLATDEGLLHSIDGFSSWVESLIVESLCEVEK